MVEKYIKVSTRSLLYQLKPKGIFYCTDGFGLIKKYDTILHWQMINKNWEYHNVYYGNLLYIFIK